MDKAQIRKRMKSLNVAVAPEERIRISERIFREVENLPAFKAPQIVAFFSSLRDEPSTSEALERWSREKQVVVPRVEGDIMQFYTYNPATMSDGSFGILEPNPTDLCTPGKIDLIVVPGVAFSPAGMRLGRGKGFYDKYMSQPGFHAFKAGVCYPHQVTDEIPVDPHDIPVDCLCYGQTH